MLTCTWHRRNSESHSRRRPIRDTSRLPRTPPPPPWLLNLFPNCVIRVRRELNVQGNLIFPPSFQAGSLFPPLSSVSFLHFTSYVSPNFQGNFSFPPSSRMDRPWYSLYFSWLLFFSYFFSFILSFPSYFFLRIRLLFFFFFFFFLLFDSFHYLYLLLCRLVSRSLDQQNSAL